MRHATPKRAQGFLSPYRVLDLTDERGLLAGAMFARMGADVVQLEPLEGSAARKAEPRVDDGRSMVWEAFAAGKRGVACDFHSAGGRALVEALASHADIVITCAPDGYDLDWAGICARHPSIILVVISAFGSDGPKCDYAASDLIVAAASGALFLNRDQQGSPLRISVPQSYLHAAADAATGALMALFARRRTGRGQMVDVSAQQSFSLTTLSLTLAAAVGHNDHPFGGPAPAEGHGKKSLDLSGSGSRTRKTKWQVEDGLVELHVGMGVSAGPAANRLFSWMKRSGAEVGRFGDWDWATLPDRILSDELSEADVDEARECVAAALRPYRKRELLQIALDEKLLIAPAMTMADLVDSDQLAARRFFETIACATGELMLPGPFAATDAPAFVPSGPAPQIGQHDDEVLAEWLEPTGDAVGGARMEGVI